jgi:succinyl-CoA synthetase beta subunit
MGGGVTALERENIPSELVWHIGSVNGKIWCLLALTGCIMAYIQVHQLIRIGGKKADSSPEQA